MNKHFEHQIGAIFILIAIVSTYYLCRIFIIKVLLINPNYLAGFVGFIILWEAWKFIFWACRNK